jgi:FkbM family methyltransferase
MLSKILRSLPQFKGKARLSGLLLKNHVNSVKDVMVTGAHGLRYTLPNLVEPVGFDIFINGIHEPETSSFIRSRIPQNGMFWDIGANIGSITLPVCKLRQDIRAVCIEASPRVYGYLQQNVRNNQIENCTLINNAVDEEAGKEVRFYSQKELYGTGSMSAVFTDEYEQVNTVTVDSLMSKLSIKRIDFIKIDIEGYEYFAFNGGQQHLSSPDAPDILFEYIDWAERQARNLALGSAQELLMKFGYKIYEFKHGRISGPALTNVITKGGWNMLFATKKPVS